MRPIVTAMNKPTKTTPHKSQPAPQSKVHTAVQQTSFSGPIPHPEILHGYDAIVPGAAERILTMAEDDAKHQRVIEMAALDAAKAEVRLGQWLGFIIGIAALGTSLTAIFLGAEVVAGIIGGTTVVGLVSAFIFGRIKQKS